MNTQGWSITPSRTSRSAISRVPSPRGMLTILSSASGPGASKRCLPKNSAPPTATDEHDEHGEDRIAGDDQRMARAAGAARRRRQRSGSSAARAARRYAPAPAALRWQPIGAAAADAHAASGASAPSLSAIGGPVRPRRRIGRIVDRARCHSAAVCEFTRSRFSNPSPEPLAGCSHDAHPLARRRRSTAAFSR